MITALILAAQLVAPVQDSTPPQYADVEGLLAEGRLKDARALLETALRADPADARAMTLLSRVYLEWPVVGRWKAWRLLRQAAVLAPDDPDPWYWKMKVGKRLGSADGEALMVSGLKGVLERRPEFRDVWRYWEEIHHGPDELREFAAILARHAGHPLADLRRSQFLTEAGEYAVADSLLTSLFAAGRDDGGLWAIRAQAALEQGDTVRGLRYYDHALRRADSDSLGLLWRQVAPIAWPDEDSTWARTAPAGREAFLRAFWAKREPDLATKPNERIVEHFARLRTARERYRLLHPQARFHSSPYGRALMTSQTARILRAVLGFDPATGVIPGRSWLEDQIQWAGLNVDVRDVPEPDSVSRYRRHGFDGRGLIYLRFGEPVRRLLDITQDVEAWDYEAGGVQGRIVFARAASGTDDDFSGGDMVLFPTNRAELHNTMVLLEHDATALPATADVVVWVAFFRGAREGEQLVYVAASGDTSAVALWDADWTEVGRDLGSSPHVLVAHRGHHQLGVDTREDARRGRLRSVVEVPTLWRGSLALSSLLIGTPADGSITRDAVARSMPANRRFALETPLVAFAEVYGLSHDRDGLSRFAVEYRFEPIGAGRAVTISFHRATPAAEPTAEYMVLQTGRVPPGRYRVYLTVRDLVRTRIAQSTDVVVEIR